MSNRQSESTEVIFAEALAKKFNVYWKRIELGNFHSYIDKWIGEYGISTHAHGMYHMEFYEKIKQDIGEGHAVLSGIFGDVFAGNVETQRIDGPDDLYKLGYTHGINASKESFTGNCRRDVKESYWEEHGERINEPTYQTVETIRLKMILISYLLKVPKLAGFEAWSPFLDEDIARSMLKLPKERRFKRKWQRDFFEREGILLENRRLKSSKVNSLDLQAIKIGPLQPLRKSRLSQYIDARYIDWINSNIQIKKNELFYESIRTKKILGKIARGIGIGGRTIKAYNAYMCLKPIEKLMDAEY